MGKTEDLVKPRRGKGKEPHYSFGVGGPKAGSLQSGLWVGSWVFPVFLLVYSLDSHPIILFLILCAMSSGNKKSASQGDCFHILPMHHSTKPYEAG